MDISAGWQVAIFFAVLLLTVKPVGAFMAAVYQGERTFLSPLLAPVERLLYRLCRIDPGGGDGLEALRRRDAAVQRGLLRDPLRHAALPAACCP